MADEEKAINTLYNLLANPPPDVDLTLVGGAALILWINFYMEHYPDNFDTDRIAGTKDIDFIALKDDARKCHEHWGGKLIKPGFNHATPEVAILCINPDSKEESVQIDFLQDLVGIPKADSLKERELIFGLGENDNIYFLNEIMVLMNRVMNTLKLSKYQNPHAYDQIHNAMAVVKSAIMAKLDVSEVQEATRLAHRVLDMARKRGIGITLFVKFGIDLLDAVQVEDERYTKEFSTIAQPILLNEVHERRESKIKHLIKRGKPVKEWW